MYYILTIAFQIFFMLQFMQWVFYIIVENAIKVWINFRHNAMSSRSPLTWYTCFYVMHSVSSCKSDEWPQIFQVGKILNCCLCQIGSNSFTFFTKDVWNLIPMERFSLFGEILKGEGMHFKLVYRLPKASIATLTVKLSNESES